MVSQRPATAALLALLALACVAAAPGSAPTPPPAHARPTGTHIDLPMAAEAESRIETIARLLASAQWQRACPLLQALIEDGSGVLWDGRVYVPAGGFATRRIAELPPDARAAYEALYGQAAQRLIDQGLAERSEPKLREAVRLYRNTAAGRLAVNAVAALRMDKGEFAAALRMLRSDGVADVTSLAGRAVAVRELVCLARLGRGGEADVLVGRLREAGMTAVEIAGRQYALGDLLADAQAQAGPIAAGRQGTPDAVFERETLAAARTDLSWPGRIEPDWPSIPSTQPVSGGGSLYVSRDHTLLAVDAQTGRIRWGVPAPGGPTEVLYAIASGAALDEDLLPLYLPVENVHHWRTYDNHGLSTLCFSDGRLYAVQMDPLRQGFPPEPWTATQDNIRLVSELRCFDGEDGTRLWSTGRTDGGALADRWFATAPAVKGGRAHALSVRRGEVRAVCLDAASGRLLWDSPIGPITGSQEGQRYAAEFFLADCGPPAVADGVAVYPTGRGVVAAFDALDGQLLWLAAYPRVDVSINRLGLQLGVPNGPWTAGRPLFCGDVCIVAPSDSRHVLGLSMETGATVWRAEFPDGVALLGMRGGRLYVQHEGVTCLDAAEGTVLWQARFDAPTTGLGVLGGGAAFVPQQEGLRRVELATGRALPPLSWPAGVAGNGNMVLHPAGPAMCSPGQIVLFRPPDESAVAVASDPAESAVVRLQAACEEGPVEEALAAYLALCREHGAIPRSNRWASAVLWPQMAQMVRDRAADDASWAAEWRHAAADAIERAVADGDEQALEEIVWYAPFEETRGFALLHLGGLLERARRPEEARRAYAEVIVRHGDTECAAPARTGLERVLGEAGAPYAASLVETPAVPVLQHAPAPEVAWRLPGILVLPDRKLGNHMSDRLLVLQRDGLACVDAATGDQAWRLALPRRGGSGGTAPVPGGLPGRQISQGFPAFLSTSSGAVVSLAGAMLRVATDNGDARWVHDEAAMPGVRMGRTPSRMRLIRWALRGMPVPPLSSAGDPTHQKPDAWDSLLACRLARSGSVDGLDPFSGQVLFRFGSAAGRRQSGATALPGRTTGCLSAVARGRLCIAEDRPPFLSVVDGRTARVLARWQLPDAPGPRSLMPTPGGNVVLADAARVFLFDLRRMRIARRWMVYEGVSELLHVDDEWIVLRTPAGGAIALQTDGDARLDLGTAGGGRPAWAAREGDTVWVLDAADAVRALHSGPDRHFLGSGFRLRAVHLPDSAPLWSVDLDAGASAIVCEPVRCGPLYLLTVAERARTRVLGFEVATGRAAFGVELPGVAERQPVPLLVEGGRVVIGLGGEVVALIPGEALPAVPSPPNAGAW